MEEGPAPTHIALSCRRLLSAVQQRRPNVLQKGTEEICKDEDVKDGVEQLIMSLSMVGTFHRIATSRNSLMLSGLRSR